MQTLSTELLKALFDFTDSDLEANRTGKLSPAQQKNPNIKRARVTNWERLIIGGGCWLPLIVVMVITALQAMASGNPLP
jgi:hypothetical protein